MSYINISVIITCYNLEKYIEDTLLSVFAQSRQADEIIVVDDCSTDNSSHILSQYTDRIKYIRMPKNSGVLSAWLRGVDESKGDVLSFIDGDDIWHINKLEEVEIAFLNDDRRILVTHDYECIDGEGAYRAYSEDPTHINTIRIVKECCGDHNKMDKLLRNSILSYKGVWLGSAFSIKIKYLDLEKYKKWVFSLVSPELSHQDQPIAGFICVNNLTEQVFYINKILLKYRIYLNNSSGASTDLRSALRTLERSYATIIRTKDLIIGMPHLEEENKRIEFLLMQNRYFVYLYSKKYYMALQKFIFLTIGFWGVMKIFKETKRLLFVFVFGPTVFLRTK